MEDAVTCEICSERFSSGKHDPLALPCGHTYCRMCLTNLKKNRDFSCPACRRIQNHVVVNKLPIIYKLLSLQTDDTTEPEYGICVSHGDELTYWCQKCQQNLCGLCLFRSHPQDHEVVKIKVSLEEKKRRLKHEIQMWQRDMEANHKVTLQKALKELKKLYQSQAQLSRSKLIISELLPDIEGACSLSVISEVETKISSLKMVAEALSSELGFLEGEVATNQEAGINNGISDPIREDDHSARCCGCIQNTDGREATIEWDGGKLLLSAFSEKPSHGELLFKMPSQLFLQLSIKDQYIGQVIIQPFYHFRRAQLFAALCLGTFGISYLGSTFRCVENKNKTREYLSGGWYLHPRDGTLTNKDLMTGLEWDGEGVGECHQGALLAVGYANGESGFGICTREQEGGTFKCLFGEVVSGIDVVKTAVRHHPVTEVTITKCGVIVPNLNP